MLRRSPVADKPEERARTEIDRLLAATGWSVQHESEPNIRAARGMAIRELPLPGYGLDDYPQNITLEANA